MILDRTGRPVRRRAFTLIEVMVVAAIIALLVAILLPGLRASRESARASVCASNLHQVAIAMQTYENENRGYRPRAGTYTSMQWIMLITRQVGDRRHYKHVNQVPVERFPVFQCPTRTATLPNPFIDYVLNGFDVNGATKNWPETQKPTPADEWDQPGRVLLVGDAAFECGVDASPCPSNPVGSDSGILRQNRENHPRAMLLPDTRSFDANIHASLDRMDLFHPSQLPQSPDRRAGSITHMKSFTNWLYADGHTDRVPWLNGKRTQKQWLIMVGVKIP
jgi:prepilin-type N-terminal cleavage/methylation domain-containing protein